MACPITQGDHKLMCNIGKICPSVVYAGLLSGAIGCTLDQQSRACRLNHGNCHIGKTKTNKMVFITEDLVSVKVLRQEKGYAN